MYPAPPAVQGLVKRFASLRHTLNETEVRTKFINGLFEALGWDVTTGSRREVKHEDRVRLRDSPEDHQKAPDYGFYIGRPSDATRQFFIEAKRPGVNLDEAAAAAFQLRRYAWSANLVVSILTNFEELAVYDTRALPKQTDDARVARVRYWRYDQYIECWDEIASLLSRDAVVEGSLIAFGQSEVKGSLRVDDSFLLELEDWRGRLAQDIAVQNDGLAVGDLNTAVQVILDRIIFLRIGEDRGIEDTGRLAEVAKRKNIYSELLKIFRRADDRYNSGLFHFRSELGQRSEPDRFTPTLKVSDAVLRHIIEKLYFPNPFVFDYISSDILGSIYERFLGKIITLDERRRVTIEYRHEVRRAEGVYYTPSHIVDFVVRQTVGRILDGKTPKRAATLKILDPACGSGSFLIGAYQYLLDWHLDYYINNEPAKFAKQSPPRLYKAKRGEWLLTTTERKRILLNSIHGVDLDQQAVEVTKLALLLKVLEGSTAETLQVELFDERVLPDLGRNIQRGNFLVGDDWFDAHPGAPDAEIARVSPIDVRRAFSAVFAEGSGFDVVLGNPPYLKEYTHRRSFEDLKDTEVRKRYYQGKMDYWYLFACRSLDMLRVGGLHSFIATNNWGTQAGASRLRAKMFSEARLHMFFDFGPFMIFRDANIQTMAYLVEKTGKPHSGATRALRVTDPRTPLPILYRALQTLKPSQFVECFDAEVASTGGTFTFIEDDDEGVLKRIEKIAPWRLGKADIGQGIVAPQETVIKKHLGLLRGAKVGDGIFILTDAERASLRLGREEKLLRPFFTSLQVHPFRVLPEHEQWVIYIDSRLAKDLSGFPKIRAHLDRFARVNTSAFRPYGLHRARDPQLFERPKILSLRKTATPVFGYCDFPCYVSQTFNIIQPDGVDLIGLTGLLNSKVVHYWLRKRGKLQGTQLQVDSDPLMAIPLFREIPKVIAEATKKLIGLCAKLHTASGPSARGAAKKAVAAARNALDREVYNLYRLTDKEIAQIEAALVEYGEDRDGRGAGGAVSRP